MTETKYTEKSIQESLEWFISSPKYRIENLYVFNWESDLLFLTQSGYWYEIEIKISRSDFFNDFKKEYGGTKKSDILRSPDRMSPNYFYYAVPKGLVSSDEIPSYAGLIEVSSIGWNIKVKAPKLRDKFKLPDHWLVDKFYHNWRHEITNHRETKKENRMILNRYSHVESTIKNEIILAAQSNKYDAIHAFKKTCNHYDALNFSCVKEDRESSRCGWCDKFKMFAELIYKEK